MLVILSTLPRGDRIANNREDKNRENERPLVADFNPFGNDRSRLCALHRTTIVPRQRKADVRFKKFGLKNTSLVERIPRDPWVGRVRSERSLASG